MSALQWLPLESNPDVMNNFLKNMGVKSEWTFVDVLGFDSEMLALIPRPAIALLLLFPCTFEMDAKSKGDQSSATQTGAGGKQPYFIVQTIRNACGTMALIHAIANNTDRIQFEANSSLKQFLLKTADLSPQERGKTLEMSSDIGEVHEHCAQEGQTQAPELNESIDYHFIAFVESDGRLYELDGRKAGPVCHGSTTRDTFLEDAAVVCKRFMDNCPNNINFTAVALVKQDS
ncbi:ubiquitin carboxyl-terminal hydrolase isozyme L3-like isoform X2 [Dinothrombium tinctorium]|uniref:Ubiquitin carboxyl-terminal hydrolase n=1 Tax=Dinothrombium tinctorium TaxID=1965070 RepID=A0A3S3SML8_9ACAR|nr:ubiquitin carboxyl-terminal hydrolase isozyme L3-like isoform X2 [Dinothrombium tinctorium]